MNSLKLTTLTMLIPLGWAASVDAYPDHFEEVGGLGNLPLKSHAASHHQVLGSKMLESKTQIISALTSMRASDTTNSFSALNCTTSQLTPAGWI